MTARFLHQDADGLLITVDLGIYSATALQKVAHRFTDRCYVHLQSVNEKSVEVRFRAKGECSLDPIAGEFCNELLDQTLREAVARETEPEKNLILAHALSRTSLLNRDEEAAPAFSDPAGIAIPDKAK